MPIRRMEASCHLSRIKRKTARPAGVTGESTVNEGGEPEPANPLCVVSEVGSGQNGNLGLVCDLNGLLRQRSLSGW